MSKSHGTHSAMLGSVPATRLLQCPGPLLLMTLSLSGPSGARELLITVFIKVLHLWRQRLGKKSLPLVWPKSSVSRW